jgi:hypothetical protein
MRDVALLALNPIFEGHTALTFMICPVHPHGLRQAIK